MCPNYIFWFVFRRYYIFQFPIISQIQIDVILEITNSMQGPSNEQQSSERRQMQPNSNYPQVYSPMRKGSYEQHTNIRSRNNFCFQTECGAYSVLRVYINANSDPQVKLYYTKYTPKIKQGTICIIHGYGQNSQQFLKCAQYFALHHFVVNMIDLRGFGYSGGSRVNSSIKATVSDIQALLRFCCQLNLPTYIMAHGLGATLSFSLLEQNPNLPIAGVIALSPLLDFPNINRNSLLHSIVLHLSPTLFDDLLINNQVNPTALTKDPFQIQKKMIGVFNFQYVTLKMGFLYDTVTYKVKKDAVKFTYPLLLCYGGKDSIQPELTVRKFYRQISSEDKQYKVFSQAFHEIHNDFERPQMLKYVMNWLINSKNSSKRKKVVWQKTSAFNLQTLTKQYHWKKLFLGILIGLIIIIRVIKKWRCR